MKTTLIFLGVLSLSGCTTHYVNLERWIEIGDAKWSSRSDVTSGVSVSTAGFLVSPKPFKNFEMHLEFMPDKRVNSGILIGCEDPKSITLDDCYEINIWDDHPNQKFRTGAIVLHSAPPFTHIDTTGKWNKYRITFKDNKVQVWLNEKLTAEMENAKFRSGYIALQSVGGMVQFRNLRLKRITK